MFSFFVATRLSLTLSRSEIMEIVEYDRAANQWVGDLHCPFCDGLTPGWRSSGMSDCFPHFFCNSCSNVIHRHQDQVLVYNNEKSIELLNQIASTLPNCPCGGMFSPNSGPNCSHCDKQIPLVADAVAYLHNPNMVVVDGACAYSDRSEPYQVRIVDSSTNA